MPRMTIMKNDQITIKSDIVILGIVDGNEYHAETYYLQLERKDGSRFNHTVRFDTAEYINGSEPRFADIHESAVICVEGLLKKVRSRGWLNGDYWVETESRYGITSR